MKISQNSILYQYLLFCNKIVNKHTEEVVDLENRDFCQLVRIALIYTPLIFLTQYIIMPLWLWYGAISPVLATTTPVLAVFPLIFLVVMVLVVFGGVYIMTCLDDQKRDNTKRGEQSSFKEFIGEAIASHKNKYCVTVEFGGVE